MNTENPQEPTAALLIIGAEILSGKVQDENGPFLIKKLQALGVHLQEIRVLEDDTNIICNAVKALYPKVTYLFTTGGIGPTHDDVTIAGVTNALNQTVIQHPDLVQSFQERYGKKLNQARLKLTEVPQGAKLQFGQKKFLPVIQVENIFIFPGVPSFMRSCFEHIASKISGAPILSRSLMINAPESEIAAHLDKIQNTVPNIAIGSYPNFDTKKDGSKNYRVKVTVDGRDKQLVETALKQILDGLDSSLVVGERSTNNE